MFKCEKHILNFTTLKNNIFFTSDTHFGHANIIKYAHRPYTDVDEMNKALIDNWNSVVKPNDIVFHLGDFMFGNINRFWEYRSRLNGKIYLVHGKVKKILIKYLDREINLNIGIRYSEKENKTLVYIATPIIKLDY